MSRLLDWFQIGKVCNIPGKIPITTKELYEIRDSFNPAEYEPPMTYGHVTKEHASSASNGWVSAMKVEGEKLFIKGKQIWDKFDKELQEGRFKTRSMGLRKNTDGKLYLHHLAWLGATSPAIQGMPAVYAEIDYSKDLEDLVYIDYSDKDLNIINKKEGKQMKEYSDAEIQELKDNAKKAGKDEVKTTVQKEFDDKLDQEKKDAEKKGADSAKKDFDDNIVLEREKANFNANIKTWLDDSAKGDESFINPAMRKAGLPTIFSALNALENDLEFSEGDKTVKKSGVEMLKDVLKAHTSNPEDELDDTDESGKNKGTKSAKEKQETKNFAEAEKIAKDENISFGQALIKVERALEDK